MGVCSVLVKVYVYEIKGWSIYIWVYIIEIMLLWKQFEMGTNRERSTVHGRSDLASYTAVLPVGSGLLIHLTGNAQRGTAPMLGYEHRFSVALACFISPHDGSPAYCCPDPCLNSPS